MKQDQREGDRPQNVMGCVHPIHAAEVVLEERQSRAQDHRQGEHRHADQAGHLPEAQKGERIVREPDAHRRCAEPEDKRQERENDDREPTNVVPDSYGHASAAYDGCEGCWWR